MRYGINSAQINHFRKEHTLILEELYRSEELPPIKELIEKIKSPTGRDIHRENPPLLSALHLSRLGQIATALFGKKRLCIAFTQKEPYPTVTAPLEAFSPLTETYGGCLLDLDSGLLTFYDATFPLDFAQFGTHTFFIAFATDKARYKFQEKDPHTHLLKKLGYGSGDKVSHDTHPVIS